MLVFEERGKRSTGRLTSLSGEENRQQTQPDVASSPRIDPEPLGGRRVLPQLRHPLLPRREVFLQNLKLHRKR